MLILLEFGFSSLTCVLPTDEADEVMNTGVSDGYHCHRMNFLLSHLHREVDVYLFCSCCANMALEQRWENFYNVWNRPGTLFLFPPFSMNAKKKCGKTHLAIKFGVFIEGVVELLWTLLQPKWKGRFSTCCSWSVFKVTFFKPTPQILHWTGSMKGIIKDSGNTSTNYIQAVKFPIGLILLPNKRLHKVHLDLV